MRELLNELTKALEVGRACTFCTLVETRGSTPQKAGAAMLVFADGTQAGTLGGGCVEAEVKQQSLRLLGDPNASPQVRTFNLDDNYGWDDGLICGGRMTMLLHPLNDCLAYFRKYSELVNAGVGCIEALAIGEAAGLPVGSRYLFDANRKLIARLARQNPTEKLIEQLPDLAKRPKPALNAGVGYLPVLPRITLLIVGGGHVGQAVARLAAEVDFDIWVLDDREKYANAERFPTAERLHVGDIGEVLKRLQAENKITPSTYCLIVTRGHSHDEEALHHLVRCAAGYVGMIGSKRKIRLIYEDLIARGISEDLLAKVHAPLGLEIGSQTVAEIAVSIVAELIACRNLGSARLVPR
jgi:xanthine dehydrogenase accessory factor